MEFTAWEGSLERHWTGPEEHREIIEIGAVKIDMNDPTKEWQYFGQLVRPSINPVLSDYFIKLTHISQSHLDKNGLPFTEALTLFQAFADGVENFYAYGGDAGVIAENCQLLRLKNPFEDKKMINAREAIKAAYGLCHSVTSAELPSATGIRTEGTNYRAHRALDDASAVADVLVPLLLSGTFKV